MRKENLLVVALVLIALAGAYLYNRSIPADKGPGQPPGVQPAGSQQAGSQPANGRATPVSSAPAGENQSGTDQISWKDYTPGMALAKTEDKSIFLYFGAPWCTYCTKLKKTTFKDPGVAAYLNDHFINIQINTDKDKVLAQKWQVKGLPTMWFLESSGKRINSMPGYVDPGQLLQILKYIHTKSYTTMEFQEFVKKG